MSSEETCWTSAADLARQISEKRISPVEVTRVLLERIQTVNPGINAYVTVTAESALAEAKQAEDAVMRGDDLGPLHGVPVSIKDMIHTRGVRMTCGSKLLENFIPQQDAVHVSRLRKAGAIIMGKTNTSEFGLKTLTDNLLFGITRNPWNPERSSGGSSGGAGAAIAAGLGPLAVGMDAGGSIRIPSSCCGVFGIKPQLGRIPRYPGLYVAELLNHDGPIARTVRDAALMLDVASGLHWGDIYSIPAPATKFAHSLDGGIKGLRIAWSPDLGYANVDAQVAAICERAVRQFSDMGAVVAEAGPGFEYPQDHFNNLFRADIAAAFSRFGPADQIVSQVDLVTGAIVNAAHEVTATDYARAMFARQDLAITVGRFFQDYDLLLTPTICEPPPHVQPADPLTFLKLLALTSPFNMTGQPAASVPAGWTEDGLPVGLQIVGRPYDEATVLRAAASFEEACPWAHRKPMVGHTSI